MYRVRLSNPICSNQNCLASTLPKFGQHYRSIFLHRHLTPMHRDLADLNIDGRITRDGFAVAFHLIQGKLSGKEIPSTLPASLMPPSMRAVTAASTSPFQQPPSDPLNDSLWEDFPVTFQSQSAILQPERTGQTQSAAISDSHTQGQINFGMSRIFFKERKVHGSL
jgi:hypothetical protein